MTRSQSRDGEETVIHQMATVTQMTGVGELRLSEGAVQMKYSPTLFSEQHSQLVQQQAAVTAIPTIIPG